MYAINSRIYKIALFYLLSFVLIYCTTAYHSLSLIVICYHSLPSAATRRVSLSFVVTQFMTCCHSLWLVVTLVVIRCATLVVRCHSLSFVAPLVVIRCHSLSIDVPLICLFINDRWAAMLRNTYFCKTPSEMAASVRSLNSNIKI